MGSRRFTEREVAEVIRRAAEIQSGQTQSGTAEGISEVELRHAARELGIAPGALDAALRGSLEDAPGSFSLLRGPRVRYEAERVFEGTLSDEAWEDTLSDLRHTFDEDGSVERRGATNEWTATGGGMDSKIVTVRQTGDSTRIRASSSLDGLAVVSYLVCCLPVFVAVGAMSKVSWPMPAEWGMVAGVGAAALMVARYTIGLAVRKRFRQFAELLDRIQARLERPDDVRDRLVDSQPDVLVGDTSQAIHDPG